MCTFQMWRGCVDAERHARRSSRSCLRRLSLCREERRLCAVSVQQANGSGSSEEFAVFFFADGSLADVAHASGGGKVSAQTQILWTYTIKHLHPHPHLPPLPYYIVEVGILFSLFFTLSEILCQGNLTSLAPLAVRNGPEWAAGAVRCPCARQAAAA